MKYWYQFKTTAEPSFQRCLLHLCYIVIVVFISRPSCYVVCVQLEYRLEQERRQRGEVEKGRRKLEGDSRSTQECEMEKNRSGLEELIKRSKTSTLMSKTSQHVKQGHSQLA